MKRKIIITKIEYDFKGNAKIHYIQELKDNWRVNDYLTFHCSNIAKLNGVLDKFVKQYKEYIIENEDGQQFN